MKPDVTQPTHNSQDLPNMLSDVLHHFLVYRSAIIGHVSCILYLQDSREFLNSTLIPATDKLLKLNTSLFDDTVAWLQEGHGDDSRNRT